MLEELLKARKHDPKCWIGFDPVNGLKIYILPQSMMVGVVDVTGEYLGL